jgi:ankyrin repeat protein
LTHEQDRGWTALHNAAHFGHEKIAELLIEYGADPIRMDKSGRTPFFLACEEGEISTARYLAQFLNQKDPSLLDKPSENGKTPFLKACARESTEIAKMLLNEIDASINIDATDKKFGRNSVHLAAYNGSFELLSLLLEHGANARVKDKKGNTPLKLCYENWGFRGSQDPSNEGFEKCLLQLIDFDRHAAVEDSELLTTATMKGSVPVLQKLLESEPRIDPNIRDQYGWTPLEIARQYRQTEAEKVLSQKATVIGKYPSRWVSTNQKMIAVGENGTDLAFVSETEESECKFSRSPLEELLADGSLAQYFSVLSDQPIPAALNRYYYEISIDPQPKRDPTKDNPYASSNYTITCCWPNNLAERSRLACVNVNMPRKHSQAGFLPITDDTILALVLGHGTEMMAGWVAHPPFRIRKVTESTATDRVIRLVLPLISRSRPSFSPATVND